MERCFLKSPMERKAIAGTLHKEVALALLDPMGTNDGLMIASCPVWFRDGHWRRVHLQTLELKELGKTHREVAKALDCTVKASQKRIEKVRRFIKWCGRNLDKSKNSKKSNEAVRDVSGTTSS